MQLGEEQKGREKEVERISSRFCAEWWSPIKLSRMTRRSCKSVTSDFIFININFHPKCSSSSLYFLLFSPHRYLLHCLLLQRTHPLSQTLTPLSVSFILHVHRSSTPKHHSVLQAQCGLCSHRGAKATGGPLSPHIIMTLSAFYFVP